MAERQWVEWPERLGRRVDIRSQRALEAIERSWDVSLRVEGIFYRVPARTRMIILG